MLAVDVGEVRADTAGRWLSSTMLGMVAEYARRSTSERTADAKRRAVARGVPPFPNTPPGYRKRKDGTLEPDKHAAAVTEAFELRAGGATIAEVRAHLAAHGIARSFHGTQALLASRIPLGELHFGKLVNETAHEAIVDPSTWRRVQKITSSPRPSPEVRPAPRPAQASSGAAPAAAACRPAPRGSTAHVRVLPVLADRRTARAASRSAPTSPRRRSSPR